MRQACHSTNGGSNKTTHLVSFINKKNIFSDVKDVLTLIFAEQKIQGCSGTKTSSSAKTCHKKR